MQVVIEISEERYNALCMRGVVVLESQLPAFLKALRNGTILPEGHGDLIDADALRKKMCDREEALGDDRALWESSAVSVALDMFAPIIIPADKDGD